MDAKQSGSVSEGGGPITFAPRLGREERMLLTLFCNCLLRDTWSALARGACSWADPSDARLSRNRLIARNSSRQTC